MFNDYMLVFADEAEAFSVLYDSSTDGEGNVTLTPKFTAVDMIGTIYEPAPDPVPEGYVPVPYPGFYANVRLVEGEDAQALEAFRVVPANPVRVWA